MLSRIFKNPFVLAAGSAGILRLAFPKFDVGILAWGAFVPFFFALEGVRPTRFRGYPGAALLGFVAGFLFFLTTIFWLKNVTAPGMVVVCLYLALYFVAFALGCVFFASRLDFWKRLFFLPSLWVVLEFVRGHLLTGFPWALLGYSQTENLAAIQAADIFGAHGVSFIVMFVNVWLFEMLRQREIAQDRRRRLIPLLILALWLGYGCWRIASLDGGRSVGGKIAPPLKVAVVQGNIPQDVKWAASFRQGIFKKYELLSELAQLRGNPDFIIWPETSFPDYFELGASDNAVGALARRFGTPLLAGAIRFQDKHFFNSAILFSSDGNVSGIYDKLHLVPFGEYLPARRLLPFLESVVPIEDFTPGEGIKIFSVQGRRPAHGMKFAVLICFEDIFAELARAASSSGADFLVNITNDGWFGDTSSPYQHMQASVFRAVENRLPVVRAANTGISCFIDATGAVTKILRDAATKKETFIAGFESAYVHWRAATSLYSKWGDFFVFLCGLFVFVVAAAGVRPKMHKTVLLVFICLTGLFFAAAPVSAVAAPSKKAADQRRELSKHYYRGVVNFEAGRYDAALAEFQEVAAVDPYYKDVQRYIENCLRMMDQYREDILAARGSVADRKTVDLYFLGKSYYEKGDYRRARETFKIVLEKNPEDKFAKYYMNLCSQMLPPAKDTKSRRRPSGETVVSIADLEKEVAYIKSDIRAQEDMETFLRKKAERKVEREELIHLKERQLKEQEELMEEERQDYLAQQAIARRTDHIRRETEKWRNMKEKLSEEEAGVPAELTEYPTCVNAAENYYVAMKESLRSSRWNSGALNAIAAGINYCDAVLIYFHSVRSASPRHENVCRLLLENVKRADVDENVAHLRSLLNLKKILDDEERPATRSEALFAAERADKLVEWCKSIFP